MKYVILAGGSGTRLWPLSRQNYAKQFIKLIDKHTMLQDTALRVSKQSGRDIFVISNKDSKFFINDNIQEILPEYTEDNLIIEPEGRNTAPAIAFGSLFFDEDDVVAILSSDHYIKDKKRFNQILDQAEEVANEGHIVTLGIVPDSPKTGYGYIKKGDSKVKSGFKVEQFVEKPNKETAEKYLADGGYFWNAGIFVFKVSVFLEELKKNAEGLYNVLQELKVKVDNKEEVTLADYRKFEKISIDYAVMERSDNIVVIPSEFGWSDVGSFRSLYEIVERDENNNALKIDKENFYNIDSKNLLVSGNKKRKIATIGLKDLVIVDTPDALLISDNSKTEQVKELVERLKENDAPEAVVHTQVFRPWGSYKSLETGNNFQVKRLIIRPGKRISLQYHHHRSENWTVVSGIAKVTKGEEIHILKPSESIYIPSVTNHRLENPSKVQDLVVIETQTGEYLGEDDIIRLEDDYKRV